MAGVTAGTLVGIEALGKIGSFFGDLLKELNEIVLYSDDVVSKKEYPATIRGMKRTVTTIRHRKVTLLEVLIALIIAKVLVWDEMNQKPIWNPISGVAPPYAAGGLIGQLLAWWPELSKEWKEHDLGHVWDLGTSEPDMADTTAPGGGGGVAPGAGGHRGG